MNHWAPSPKLLPTWLQSAYVYYSGYRTTGDHISGLVDCTSCQAEHGMLRDNLAAWVTSSDFIHNCLRYLRVLLGRGTKAFSRTCPKLNNRLQGVLPCPARRPLCLCLLFTQLTYLLL